MMYLVDFRGNFACIPIIASLFMVDAQSFPCLDHSSRHLNRLLSHFSLTKCHSP